jgi:hypothetical protein
MLRQNEFHLQACMVSILGNMVDYLEFHKDKLFLRPLKS